MLLLLILNYNSELFPLHVSKTPINNVYFTVISIVLTPRVLVLVELESSTSNAEV